MKTSLIQLVRLFGIAALLMVLAGCAEMPPSKGAGASAGSAAAGSEQVASGTQGDTLAACLKRIPSDASAGQRMFAEASCQRDEQARQAINAVPGQ